MKITWGRKPKPEAKLGRITRCDICDAEVPSQSFLTHWLHYHDASSQPQPPAEFEVVIVPLSSLTPKEDQTVVPCRDRDQAVAVNDELHRREPHTFRTTIRAKQVLSS